MMAIRREVQAEIDATRAAMAALRAAVMVRPVASTVEMGIKPRLQREAGQMLTLAELYTEHTGVELTIEQAPEYTAEVVAWPWRKDAARRKVINAIHRLRSGAQSGVVGSTARTAMNYFASIWPCDLAWPVDIPRPEKKDAA